MTWYYLNAVVDEIDIKLYPAFVYKITNLTNNKIYIGRKVTEFSRNKVKRPSDWRNYYGSNDNLKADIKLLGKDKFKREILRFCTLRTESKYYENKFIFEVDALIQPDKYYNEWVAGDKITRKHLKRYHY